MWSSNPYQWFYAYDRQDRVIQITYPDGTWVRTARDGRGAIINEYVGLGGDTINGTGGTTVLTNTYGYNSTTGNLESRTNQTAADQPNQTTYGYDSYNRRISRTDQDDGSAGYNIVTTYDYNAGQDVIDEYVQRGAGGTRDQYIERDFDELGRVWKETVRANPAAADSGKDRITYTTYDLAGNEKETRVKDVLKGDAVTSRTYTCFNYPLTMTQALTGSTNALTTYTPDIRGNVTITVDPVGNQTEQDYDALSQITQSRFYEGNGTSKALKLRTDTAYTSRKQRARQTQYDAGDVALDQQRWEYDALGNQSQWARMAIPSTTNIPSTSLDRIIDSTSDGVGRKLTQTTYDGGAARMTTWHYTGQVGRLNDIVRPVLGNTETFTYYPNTTRVYQHTVTDPINSRVTETSFDGFGRLKQEVQKVPAGVSGINDVKKQFQYDAANRRLQEIQVVPEFSPTSVITRNQYDGIGQLTQVDEDYTGTNQRTVSFAFTQKGDLLTQTTNDGEGSQVTTFDYDRASHRTSVQRPGATAATFTPDAAGRIQSRQAEDTFVTWYKRDWRGNELEKRQNNSSGTVLEVFTYDPLGRMTAASVGPAATATTLTTFTYANGTDLNGDSINEGAFVDEPVVVTQRIVGTEAAVKYAYNTAGKRTKLIYPGSGAPVLTYGYDGFDQVLSIDRNGSRLVNYTYAGRSVTSRQARTSASGAETWVEVAWDRPDQLRRPKTLTNRLRTGSTNGVGGSTVDMIKFDNLFDAASNLRTQAATGWPLPRNSFNTYSYDQLSRLRHIAYPGSVYEDWSLDAWGNWITYTPRSGSALSFTDNIRDEYVSVTGQAAAPSYDAKGNMTRDDRGYGYAFDFENRLIKVFTDTNRNGLCDSGEPVHATYLVDALGHRVITTIGSPQTYSLYDGDEPLAEYAPASWPAGPAKRTFINGAAVSDEKVLVRLDSGTEYYFQQDHLGSIVAMAKAGGVQAAGYIYDGYGQPTVTGPQGDVDSDGAVILADLKLLVAAWNSWSGQPTWNPSADVDRDGAVILADLKILVSNWNLFGVESPFGFTGQRFERLDTRQLVLCDYKARTYLPRLGRFLQLDPAGPADGYNLYVYTMSNPLRYDDPTGCLVEDPLYGIMTEGLTMINNVQTARNVLDMARRVAAGASLQSVLLSIVVEAAAAKLGGNTLEKGMELLNNATGSLRRSLFANVSGAISERAAGIMSKAGRTKLTIKGMGDFIPDMLNMTTKFLKEVKYLDNGNKLGLSRQLQAFMKWTADNAGKMQLVLRKGQQLTKGLQDLIKEYVKKYGPDVIEVVEELP